MKRNFNSKIITKISAQFYKEGKIHKNNLNTRENFLHKDTFVLPQTLCSNTQVKTCQSLKQKI